MIQFENSKYIVIIEDSFVESLIKTAQRWKGRIKQNIEKLIVEEAVCQMEDGTGYIRFSFNLAEDTSRELTTEAWLLSFIVSKKCVTIKDKWKKVRIKEGSFYEGLNDNPEFIEAMTKKYDTNHKFYTYYLPVSYKTHLVSKDGAKEDFMKVHVDIPFSDIEVC